MKYQLTNQQEEKFSQIYATYQDKIKLVLYKTNIHYKDYDYFYTYALEGLLVAFLILEAGDIKVSDFDKFAYMTMKRKVIDELRRLNQKREVAIDLDTYTNIATYQDSEIVKIDYQESIAKLITKEEKEVLSFLEKGSNIKEICQSMHISKSKCYEMVGHLKEKIRHLIYN